MSEDLAVNPVHQDVETEMDLSMAEMREPCDQLGGGHVDRLS